MRPPSEPAPARERVLVFSKTAGFRHDSIPDGHRRAEGTRRDHDITVDATEDAGASSPPATSPATTPWCSCPPPVTSSTPTSRRRSRTTSHAAAATWASTPPPTPSTTGPSTAASSAPTSSRTRRSSPPPSRVEDHAHPATAHLGDGLEPHRRVVQLPHQPPRPGPCPGHPRRDHVQRRHHEGRPSDRLVPGPTRAAAPSTPAAATPRSPTPNRPSGSTCWADCATPPARSRPTAGRRTATGRIFNGTTLDGWKQAGPGHVHRRGRRTAHPRAAWACSGTRPRS